MFISACPTPIERRCPPASPCPPSSLSHSLTSPQRSRSPSRQRTDRGGHCDHVGDTRSLRSHLSVTHCFSRPCRPTALPGRRQPGKLVLQPAGRKERSGRPLWRSNMFARFLPCVRFLLHVEARVPGCLGAVSNGASACAVCAGESCTRTAASSTCRDNDRGVERCGQNSKRRLDDLDVLASASLWGWLCVPTPRPCYKVGESSGPTV